MTILKVSGDGIEDNAITNAHLHSSAEIAATKLANSGVTAGSYGSGSAIPAITVNAKGLITSVSTSSINTDLVADTSPQLGGDLDLNSNDITGTGNFNITGTLVATSAEFSSTSSLAALIAKGDGSSQDGYIQLNCSQNSHGIKLKSPPHSASQSYTLTFPSDIQNAKFLTTDANGNLSWASPTDQNFTNADHSKLDGIEAGATADQTASEIRALVESASDSNVFTDADHSKLNGIEASATADQTASEILTLIKTVDGTGSGLDADTLDGSHSGSFINTSSATQLKPGALRLGGSTYNLAISFSGVSAANTVGHTASNSEGIFWHTHQTNYAIYRTAGAWGAPNYQQLRIDWPTGIILDGGDQYGKSGVRMASKLLPVTDSTYDIGASANRFANGYFDTLYGDGSNLTNLPTQSDQNFTTALKNKLDGIAASATNVTNNNQLTNGAGYITSAALVGANNGGNAALLDGIDSTQFLRADQDDSTTGILSLETNSQYPLTIDGNDNGKIVLAGSADPYIRFREGTTDKAYIQWTAAGIFQFVNQESGEYLRIKTGVDGLTFTHNGTESKIFHAGNDGSGSNLDADKLDGQQGSYYLDYGNLTNVPTISSFPSGTRMIFQQTSAPTGWTKDTSDTNQRALRVVSGSASSGGSVDFTTAFASKGVSGSIANGGNNTNSGGNNTNNATAGGSVNNHTLSEGRMPSHKHIGGDRNIFDQVNGFYGQAQNNAGGVNYPGARYDPSNPYAQTDKSWTSNAGSTQAHNHGFSGSAHSHSINSHSHTINAHNHSFSGTAINLAVRYLDVIIAQKD
jgi:hypothetical protein